MTTWEDVVRKIVTALQTDSVLKAYAKVVLKDSLGDYTDAGANYLIVVSPPEADTTHTESLIGGVKRRYFDVALAIAVKNEPTGKARLYGERGKGIFEVQADVERILEHNNFSGAVDNKAGSNFEQPWTKAPLENRAVTLYTTIYTAVVTE